MWWIWLIPLTWPIDIANPLDLHVLNELIDSIHVISVIDAYGLPIVISIWCGWLRIYTTLICTKVEDALEPCTGPELHCSLGDKSASHWTTTATDLNHDGNELKPQIKRTWTKKTTDLNHDGYGFEPQWLWMFRWPVYIYMRIYGWSRQYIKDLLEIAVSALGALRRGGRAGGIASAGACISCLVYII